MNKPFDITLIDSMKKVELSNAVNYLIEQDFNALIQILYSLDINENKLKKLLHDNTSEDAGDLIADMIIQRQTEKASLKKQFKQKDDIPEEDKW
jgi:hypothetical protein